MRVESWKASPQTGGSWAWASQGHPSGGYWVWFSDLENIRLRPPALIPLSPSKFLIVVGFLPSFVQGETLHRAAAPDTSPLAGHL